MKTLKFFRFLLIVVLGATLMFSCSDDESLDDASSNIINTRNDEDFDPDSGNDTDPECFVNLCVTFTDSNNPNFNDLYVLQLPTVGNVIITNDIITFPDGTTEPLVDNEYCLDVPIFAATSAIANFKGYGAAVITGTWANGAICEVFSAGVGTDEFVNVSTEVPISCESPCPPPPDCFVDVCVTVTESTNPLFTDLFIIQLPTIGNVNIQNGIVTLPDGTTEMLDANGEFCTTIPLFDPTTAFLSFFGFGAVEVNATWEDNTTCLVYEAGVGMDSYTHICEEVELTCTPSCPPPPDCYINVCATITDSNNPLFTDIFVVQLPSVGNVTIQNGIVTAPNGDTFPLDDDNQFCTNIPITDEVTAFLSFFGFGAVEVTATWPDNTTCDIFDAGVGTDDYSHVCEEITLDCEPTCPPPPDCLVDICAQIDLVGPNDIYIVQLPNVGNVTVTNGTVTLPNGQTQPLDPSGEFCVTIPLYGASSAILTWKGTGSVVTTGTWGDQSCEIFSAGVGTSTGVKKSELIELTCEPPCPPTCEVDICVTLTPNPDSDFQDSYVVTLPNGAGQIFIQNGVVTLPNGEQQELVDNQFCTTIEIEEGSSFTAVLSFVGAGTAVTTASWGGTTCVIFKAGSLSSPKIAKKKQETTLSCDPVC